MNRTVSPLVAPPGSPFEFGERKTVGQGRHISLVADSVQAPGKKPFDYEIAVRNNDPRIVSVLPITKEGEALLIWQYRVPMRRYVLENVAGLVDPGMNSVQTVVKEILEETGYAVSEGNVVDLKITTPASSGATTEKVECFAAFGAEFAGAQRLEAAEEIAVVRLPLETAFETALATAAAGELVDAKVFALLAVVKERFERAMRTGE